MPEETQKPQNPEQEGSSENADQPLFYNVMPNIKSSNKLTTPEMQVQITKLPVDENPHSFKKLVSKYKTSIIIVVGFLILASAGYILYNRYLQKAYKPDDIILNNQTKHNSTSTPESNNATSTLTSEWLTKYFNSPDCQDQSLCGTSADPDHDGLTNTEEFQLKTDPNNPDSDGDGLADGDEVHVFGTDPLKAHSVDGSVYMDSDYIKGAYVLSLKDQKLTPGEINELGKKMQAIGLHEPTVKTLDTSLSKIYNFQPGEESSSSTPSSLNAGNSTQAILASLDTSPEAKQERDNQRLNTIKNTSIALANYYSKLHTLPDTNDFGEMVNEIKPYAKVGINPKDPIDVDPYVYSYETSSDKNDFTISFYSETQRQVIKYHLSDGQKFSNQDQADINDNQRKSDLESLRLALLLYSQENVAGNQSYVFPAESALKTALVPTLMSSIPKDPKTGQDYDYKVSATFDTFTLKAALENPSVGTTGYLCNQDEECRYY